MNDKKKENKKSPSKKVIKERPLTGKQELFCPEYIKDFNGTRSVIAAGYSKSGASVTAYHLLRNAKIQARLTELKDTQKERMKNELDADYVLRNIMDIADKCMAAVPYMEKVDGEWKAAGEYRINHNGALKAMELLGKHLALFTEKIQINGTIGISFQEGMKEVEKKLESNKPLLELIKGGLKD